MNESIGTSIFTWLFVRINFDNFPSSFETKLCIKHKGKIFDTFLIADSGINLQLKWCTKFSKADTRGVSLKQGFLKNSTLFTENSYVEASF